MIPEDKDPIETSEWLEAINSVIEEEGVERGRSIGIDFVYWKNY